MSITTINCSGRGSRDTGLGDLEPPPDHENQSHSTFQWLKWEYISPDGDITSLQYYYNYNQQELTNENLMIKLGADSSSSAEPHQDRSAQSYDKLDIKISKTRKFDSGRLQYALVLQNLLEDYYDYNKTRYNDATQTVVAPSSSSINANGSLQDRRVYLELSWMFN